MPNVTHEQLQEKFNAELKHPSAARLAGLVLQDVDFTNAEVDGLPILHWAVKNNHRELTEVLLGKKANIDAQDKNGNTPLITAIQNGHTKLAKILIKNGSEINRLNQNVTTPLMFAIINNNTEVAKLLMDNGADLNAKSANNDTALIIAINNGNTEIAKLLIDKGADLNLGSANHDTPLILAVKTRNEEIVESLIAKGANPNIQNDNGHSAYYYNAKMIDKAINKAVLQTQEKLKTALDAPNETEEVIKAIKEVVASPYFKDLGRLKDHKNIERLYKPLKEYAATHQNDKVKAKMAARVEGVIYGRASQESISSALDDLYHGMYKSYHRNNTTIPPKEKDELQAKAGKSIADSMNKMLSNNDLIIGIKIKYNKTTKMLEAKYEENPELYYYFGRRLIPTTRNEKQYARDIDTKIGWVKNSNPEVSKSVLNAHIKELENLKDTIKKAGPVFEQQKDDIQAKLDKMNEALKGAVQNATDKAADPLRHHSFKKTETALICGLVASIVIGAALVATGIGALVVVGAFGSGLVIGLGSTAFAAGLLGGITGFISFTVKLCNLQNKSGKEDVIEFIEEARESMNDLKDTVKEIRSEAQKATAPEKEVQGKFTSDATNAASQTDKANMPDIKRLEGLISGMAKQLETLAQEVTKAREEASAARQEAQEAKEARVNIEKALGALHAGMAQIEVANAFGDEVSRLQTQNQGQSIN